MKLLRVHAPGMKTTVHAAPHGPGGGPPRAALCGATVWGGGAWVAAGRAKVTCGECVRLGEKGERHG